MNYQSNNAPYFREDAFKDRRTYKQVDHLVFSFYKDLQLHVHKWIVLYAHKVLNKKHN